MVRLEKLGNGNLKIVLTDKEELLNVIDRKQDERDALYDMLERSGLTKNGWWGVIFNAGLTEAPTVGEDVFCDADSGNVNAENIWYYNEYMIKDYLSELKENGYVIFTAHQENKKEEVKFSFTRKEMINMLDQFMNCPAEGVRAYAIEPNIHAIESWVDIHSQYWE
jgi:hypothetical protein